MDRQNRVSTNIPHRNIWKNPVLELVTNVGSLSLLVGGWATHLKNMLVNLEIFPNFRGENKKCLKPPPRFDTILHRKPLWKLWEWLLSREYAWTRMNHEPQQQQHEAKTTAEVQDNQWIVLVPNLSASEMSRHTGTYLEDHPRTCRWLIAMVIGFIPKTWGCWTPSKWPFMASKLGWS